MNKKHILYIACPLMAVIAISLCVYGGIRLYRSYKRSAIVEETNLQIMLTKSFINNTKNDIEKTSHILIPSEKEKLLTDIDTISNRFEPIKSKFVDVLNISSDQEVRSQLEPGFDENPETIPIITQVKKVHADVDSIAGFCTNRQSIYRRAITNEYTLKAILKKPLIGSELPNELALMQKFSPGSIKDIPQETNELRLALESYEPILNNCLGAKLVNAKKVLDEIVSISKHQKVTDRATAFFQNCHDSYLKVKPINDTIHWYVPTEDDGKYDTQKYNELIANQSKALTHYEHGNVMIESLERYRSEIKNQYAIYVSDTSYESCSFRHSRTVTRSRTRHTDKGTYIERYSDTEYYYTDGRKFFYTKRTVTPNGSSDEKIFVGSTDSDNWSGSFGAWRNWDYKYDQQEGYLVQYKPYGLDNSFIVSGGQYNPTVHCMTR